MIKLFRSEGKEELLEDIDEMLSAIDNGEDMSNFDVPERIKRESRVTERLLNFYVTLVGGLSNARGDSFYLRLMKPQLLEHFSQDTLNNLLGSDAQLEIAGNLIFQYSKNINYYQYINENLRAGKNRFQIPTKVEHLQANSNFTVIKMATEGMIAAFFQDLNPKETKLTIKNAQLLSSFRKKFGNLISDWVKQSPQDFIKSFYAPTLTQRGKQSDFSNFLVQNLSETDLSNLKESLYKIDFWLNYRLIEQLKGIKFTKRYGEALTMSCFGLMRETLLGLMILLNHLKKNSKLQAWQIDTLISLYVEEILSIKHAGHRQLITAIEQI